MRNFIKAFLFFLLWSAIALTSHFFLTHKKFNNCTSISTNFEKETIPVQKTKNIFFVTHLNDTIFKAAKGFSIEHNTPFVSSLDSLQNLTNTVKNSLNGNYNNQLELIGKYASNEQNTIGTLRATNLKNQFIKKGVDASAIKIGTKKTELIFNKFNKYLNGIFINVVNRSPKEIDSIEQLISTQTLYTQVKNGNISTNTKLDKYIYLLKQYQKNNPTKKITITGHTDNKGYFQNNLTKGQLKADALKRYFLNQGIQLSIQSFSKGEAEPIANKYTIKGRALNNRIEIKIN